MKNKNTTTTSNKRVTNPFDSLFKRFMAEPNNAKDFFDGFGENKQLAKKILCSPFQLASISGVTQQQLEKHPLAGTLSRIYQMAFARDIISELNSLRKQLCRIDEQHGSDLILAMLEFILYKAEKGDAYAIIEAVQAIVSDETGEKVMTLSEQLINDGIQQGMQQGIKKGMEQEKLIIAKQMLLEGIQISTILKVTGLNFSQLKELGHIDNESE